MTFLQAISIFLGFLAIGANGKSGCTCTNPGTFQRTNDHFPMTWWKTKRDEIQGTFSDNFLVNNFLVNTHSPDSCTLETRCNFNGGLYEIYQLNLLFGTAEGKMMNVSYLHADIVWPKLKCGKNGQWMFNGHSIQVMGCVNVSKEKGLATTSLKPPATNPTSPTESPNCKCVNPMTFPINSTRFPTTWWSAKKDEVERGYNTSFIVNRFLVNTHSPDSCTLETRCNFNGGFWKIYELNLFMGTPDGKMLNASYLYADIVWPKLTCGNNGQWTFKGHNVEVMGCVNVSVERNLSGK